MVGGCVVVGAGVYGASLAWRLAESGVPVELLEAETVAAGASGGPGFRGVRASARHVAELPLMRRAYELWPWVTERLGVPEAYVRTGGVRLFENELTGTGGGWRSAAALRDTQVAHGIPTEMLSGDEVRRRHPHLGGDLVGAVYCPNDGIADQKAVTEAFVRAAREAGANVREGARVERLEVDGGVVQAVVTSAGERIPVPGMLALLANTGVPELVAGATGVRLPTWEMSPQVTIATPGRPVGLSVLVGHDSRTVAVKTLPDGRLMISGGWPGGGTGTDVPFCELPERARRNYEQAVAVVPALEDVTRFDLDATRADTMCVDGLPVIDYVPGLVNAVLGTGWTGHGFAISVAVTELMAEWLTGGAFPGLFAPFRYRRFAAPVVGGSDE